MTTPLPNVLDATRSSPLGQGLDDSQQALLAGVLRVLDCAPQQVLADEGEVDERLYVVLQGQLAVFKHLGQPDEERLLTLGAGEFAHELGFLDEVPRYASLRAETAARVLVLERQALESLIDTQPRLLYALMRKLLHAGRGVHTRLAQQTAELTNYIVKQHGRY